MNETDKEINIPRTGKERVLIVGGGFGGLKLARKLSKLDYQVVMIDRNNYHQFQPLFYQVATSGLEPSSISFPIRKIFQKSPQFFFRIAELQKVMPDQKKVYTTAGIIPYDHLVLAVGVDTNFFGNENIRKHALPMKSLVEALDLRNHILENYEEALGRKDPKD
ncbi:MAG TPA: FAD-dependent oxidoreductase, partial [Bacteroidia bacterium]